MKNNLDYVVYAFATPNYYHYMDRLEKSLIILDIKYKTDRLIKNSKTKRIGSLQKPSRILEFIESIKMPVLYVDCDSIFNDIPIIPNLGFDVGIVNKKESGMMPIYDHIHFYNFTKKAINFLKHWKNLCDDINLIKKGDHKRLSMTRNSLKNKYKELSLNSYVSKKITGYDNNHKKYIEIG